MSILFLNKYLHNKRNIIYMPLSKLLICQKIDTTAISQNTYLMADTLYLTPIQRLQALAQKSLRTLPN